MKRMLMLVPLLATAVQAAPVPFTYRFESPQKVMETAAGALSDGDPKTIAHWKGAVGSVVCELPGTTELSAVEVTIRKATNWYLMEEVEVSVDDGTGEFGGPKSVKVDIPRYDGKAPTVDASCTNMTYRLPLTGKTSRVRVRVKSAAHGALAGIRIESADVPAVAAAKPTAAEKSEEEPSNLVTVENRNFQLKVTPLGGRAYSLYSKFLGVELTNPSLRAGSFSEFDWSKRPNKWFFREKPFILKPFDRKDEKGLDASGNFRGGGTDFLVVNKRYTMSDDSTALKVDYRFENLTDAMSALDYSLLIHTTLGINGRLCSYYYPTEEGIVEIERDKRPLDRWFHHPSRGWMAAVDDLGRGIAVTMPFKEVKSFYSWYAKDVVPTLEWRMIPVSIDCGKSYEVPTEVIAFKGLKKVSGAGGGLVGEIADGTVTVFSSRAGKIVAKAGGKTVELVFAKMGMVKSFKTDAATVILEKDGKEVCRLEAPPKDGAWELAALEKSRVSSVKSFDLTCYTNFPHQVCQPFAKPLAVKRRPRIAAFTGTGNNIELGFFADRFDCELLTSTVSLNYYRKMPKCRAIQNPIYDNGDYFGSLSTADVEENIVKTLKKDIDAILIGGLPWEIFPKEIKKLILEKVKSGVGLVWIGQDRAAPEIGRVGEAKRIAKCVPVAVTAEFADVPFALLGAEPFYAFKTDGVVHAAADGNAWLVEGAIGKGKVFHLAYEAIFGELNNETGITPNLRDYYPDRVAPVEYYYSLVAKCLAKAAKVELPVSFAKADVNGERAALKVVSVADYEATAECVVRTRFGELIAKGRKTLSLRAGENEVELPLAALRPYAGALACEVVLRDGAGRVLNWGAWAFEKNPSAAFVEFSAGKSAPGRTGWREGDSVPFAATVKGETAGRNVRFRVADSYGRILQERTMPAAAKMEDGFRIANELPARTYEITASLMEGDREIDRLRTEVRVRPDPAKWPWDDFLFGFWTGERLREYLWPEFAKLFRTMHATANIANQWRMAIDFPSRYGFDPTLLSGAGLGQCGEPPDYVKTGDKMKLLRKPCLSDPKFFAKQDKDLGGVAKRIADLGLRYVWFGDEQSLTGYGGKPIDFCFSEHCLKEFRAFLKERYGTLEKLNAVWETSFADWDAVVPFTRQEVWAEGGEKHVAGWADHLEFMDGRLANSLDYAGKLLKSGDPNIATSVSGTQAPTAYGGMDWWKQVKVLDGALSYHVGGQLELHRSFKPDGQFMPWNWGYSARGAKAIANVWRTLFVGCRGVIGFHDLSIFNPDWTWSAGYKEVKPSMDRIDAGLGKHLIHNLKGEPSIAVLYSQASIRAAFFENRREEHSKLRDKYIQLLHHLGYAFDFVSYEQLADGTFESHGYKALILADATAMSDAEVAAVERFAAKGGAVLAEGVPATREGNCRKRTKSPLARFVLIPKVDVSYLKALEYPAEPENAALIAAEQDRFEMALAKAGVNPPRLLMTDATNGERFRLAETYAREGRGALFWGVISNDKQDRVIDFSFPKKGHLYDIASGKHLGFGDRFKLPLAMGRPYAFELLDERPAISGLTAEEGKIRVAYSKDVDSVIYLRIYDPKGQEVEHYSRKLVVKNGSAEISVPFALSDPKGEWRVTATDIFGDEVREVRFNHN